MTMRLLQLGNIVVPGGIKGDPCRAKRIVGDYSMGIDFTPAEKWFPRVNEWPEGTIKVSLAIAWFPGEIIDNFDAVIQMLACEGINEVRLTMLSHLVAAVFPRCDELWQKYLDGEGPYYIMATHPASFLRDADGFLRMPLANSNPRFPGIVDRWIGPEVKCTDKDGFLVIH